LWKKIEKRHFVQGYHVELIKCRIPILEKINCTKLYKTCFLQFTFIQFISSTLWLFYLMYFLQLGFLKHVFLKLVFLNTNSFSASKRSTILDMFILLPCFVLEHLEFVIFDYFLANCSALTCWATVPFIITERRIREGEKL
jgi:hypothetical protein